MSKIFISTNLDKAKSCFNRLENEKSAKVEGLINVSENNPIQQINDYQLFLHLDSTNPNFKIDSTNDLLLYHSQTNGYDKLDGFLHKFNNKVFDNHPGKFKKAFEILVDEDITDKYKAIKSAVFPNVNTQISGQIGVRFLEGKEIDKKYIKNLLGNNYTGEIEEILKQNLAYQEKKSNSTNTKEDDNLNNDNWRILQRVLKASNE